LIASDGRTALTRLSIGSLQWIGDLAAIRSHADIDRVAVQVENTSVHVNEVADGLREWTHENAGVERAPVLRHAACARRATATARTTLTGNPRGAACAALTGNPRSAACATVTTSARRAALTACAAHSGRAACARFAAYT